MMAPLSRAVDFDHIGYLICDNHYGLEIRKSALLGLSPKQSEGVMGFIERRGHLYCDEIPVQRVLDQVGATPFYLYSRAKNQ